MRKGPQIEGTAKTEAWRWTCRKQGVGSSRHGCGTRTGRLALGRDGALTARLVCLGQAGTEGGVTKVLELGYGGGGGVGSRTHMVFGFCHNHPRHRGGN